MKMLEIEIPKIEDEWYDDGKEEFIYFSFPGEKLQLEHSLISISKYESKFHKPYYSKEDKSVEEVISYIGFMSLKPIKDFNVFVALSRCPNLIKKIKEYMDDEMTATTFTTKLTVGASRNSREKVTSEIIYYWMVELGIPVEFEKWHINRLLTLIKVVSLKTQPNKKMDPRTAAMEREALNNYRKAKWKTKG